MCWPRFMSPARLWYWAVSEGDFVPFFLGDSGLDHSTDWMQRDDSETDLAEDCALVGWTNIGAEGERG